VTDEPKSRAVNIERGSPEERRARFDVQVLPHLDAAYRFARWLARSPADADDVVQEAMLRAFRGFDGLRGGDVKAWLFTIVRNCHLTALTQRERRGFVPLPAEGDPHDGAALVSAAPGPESVSMSRDEARSLERLLAELPPEHREVLILREIEELDYREIAAVTQVPIGTVMSRLARARGALKARWSMRREEECDALR
jgi:RNA polymerase sigma-70 factor, ECF subfamily